ncbi:MAG: type VII secretion-associated serine protease mycosin [Mycobacteriaceae bacterium]|nr:type VII secretion-associated serine protease mycosin [Mycobacteriaceae bacterium]
MPTTPEIATNAAPISQRYLNFQDVWKFTRGQGVKVAVIDTGVSAHPRLSLTAGGDYVGGANGLEDCDAHGTIVAGIIAGKDTGHGFAGVAPDASIITLRAQSAAYELKGTQHREAGEPAKGYGPLGALGAAIVHAVNIGAAVVNVSLTYCSPSSKPMRDDGIGAAVKYAYQRNVVVVAASGNRDGDCQSGNDNIVDPVHPDKSPWDNVTLNVSPARFSDYVLAVGSVSPKTGQPSTFTVPGPWVGVAAPGEEIVSLDPNSSGLTSRKGPDDKGNTVGFQGTSFAAPYVSGLAALVRARYPHLTAGEVIKRIEQTAHAPGGGWNPYVGYGIVDPLAAVTADLAADMPNPGVGGIKTDKPYSYQLPIPAPEPAPDHRPRNAALVAAGAILLALILGLLAVNPLNRKPPE